MNSSRKSKYILTAAVFAAATVLACTAYLVSGRHARSVSEVSRSAFSRWAPENAAEIEISWIDRKVTLYMKSGRWLLKERGDAQAATAEIATLLQQLSSLRPLKEIEFTDHEDLSRANLLEQPEKDSRNTGVGVTVKVKDKSGALLLDMILGIGHVRIDPERIGQYDMQSYDGRYVLVRKPGEPPRVFLISHVFERCHPTCGNWLDQLKLYGVDRPVQLRYLRRGKKGDMDPVWWVAATARGIRLLLPQGGNLSTQKVRDMLTVVSSPFSLDLIPAGETVKDKQFTDEFHAVLDNGISYRLELGQKKGDTRVLGRLHVAFNAAAARIRPGESKDDFEQRKRNTAERADFEKTSWDGKIFLIRSDLIEKLSAPPVM